MKKLYILILLSSISSAVFAQLPIESWINASGGNGKDDVYATCVDPSGNVYIAGSFTGTVDFDGGANVLQKSASNDTDLDGFVMKVNTLGVPQWVTTFGGIGDDKVYGVTADANGVYVTGYFNQTADFDPVGTSNQISAGGKDIFIAKYNSSNGNLVFVNTFGDVDDDWGAAVAVDGNSIYLTGSFSGVVDFDPSTGSATETTWGGSDAFLASYTTSGAFQWSHDMGSSGFDEGTSVITDGTSVWLGGDYSDNFYVDPNDYSVYLTNAGTYDGFGAQYSATDGSLISWGTISSSGDDFVTSLAFDNNGGLYVAGEFSNTAIVSGSTGEKSITSKGFLDCFVARYSLSDLSLTWLNSFGSADNDYLASITADAGSVHLVGTYGGVMDVDPSPTTVNLPFTGDFDSYYLKYNYVAGALANSFSLASANASDDVEGRGIAFYRGNIFYTGVYKGAADLDPGPANTSSNSTLGSFDWFLLKFIPAEPSASPTSISITNVGATSAKISVTSALVNDGYITLYNTTGVVTAVPVDNTIYNRDDSPGGGLGKVLNVTPGSTSYTVTGLTPSTTYNVSIFSYNGASTTGGVINYKTSFPQTGGFSTIALSTEPTLQPTNFVSTNIQPSSFTISYTAPSPAPAGYIALRTSGAAVTPNADPSDGIGYAVGDNIGNATVAYVGPAITFDEVGLTFATTYNYKIYSYAGSSGNINYRQTSPLQGTVSTVGSAEPTAQPTTLTFSSITTTSYHFEFTASVDPNVDGYVGIRRTGVSPTFVPTDGIELNGGDTNGDGSVVNFIGTSTAYNQTSVSANTKYYFVIYAYSGSGTSINYLQVSPLTGNVTTLSNDDTTKPTISDHTPTTIGPTDGLTISVDVTDAGGVDRVWVEYYPINSSRYDKEDLTLQTGSTYAYNISNSFNTEQGIEYKVHATDVSGNQQDQDWKSVIRNYTGTGLSIPYSSGSDKTNYRIISIPLTLTANKVNDVFDELGPYDKTKYRLFHYASNTVAELSGTSPIELGKGYWFIASQQTTINTGAGTTALTGVDNNIAIPISNGWNQIGNPYNFDVDWTAVVNNNSDKTFTKYKTYEGKFNDGTKLKTMAGGFVMVSAVGDGQLLIPVNKDARLAAPTPTNFAQTIDSDTWGVDLIVKSGDLENNFAGFGMHPDASEQSDKYDDYTLPRFVDYLELNYNKKLFGSAYTKDIVPTSAQHVWEFELASNVNNDVIELSWDNSYFGSSDLQLVLWDVNQQRAIDMKSQNMYAIERSHAGKFKIFYGSESFVKQETLPNMAVFHSASPVPSSGNVTFAFSVPDSDNSVKTNLSIYNTLGQKVSKLVDETLPAGYHQAVWNIEDGIKPAVGVYISVLTFGETTLQKRVVVK